MLNIYEEFKDVLMLVDSACTLQRRFYFIDATMIILFPAFIIHSLSYQQSVVIHFIILLANNKGFTQPGRQQQ